MKKLNKNIFIIVIVLLVSLMFLCYKYFNRNYNNYSSSIQVNQVSQNNIFNENKEIVINKNYSFIFKFITKPKIGEVIVKVEIFDTQGNKVNNLRVLGGYDMPSMRGHHASGEQLFMLNQKGSYLLPVHIAMSGNWEVVISITEDNNEIYQGKILFKI